MPVFLFLFATMLMQVPEVTATTGVNFPHHIEKGEQLYVLETPETQPLPDRVWYRQAFCGVDPSCDRVQSIFPDGSASSCLVPEPASTWLVLPGILGMMGVWWLRRKVC